MSDTRTIDSQIEAILADLHGHHEHSTASDTCTKQAKAELTKLMTEARIDELERLKKRATRHVAYKQGGWDDLILDTKDDRLAVPVSKIDEELEALRTSTDTEGKS